MSKEIINKIKEKGYWRVVIRPTSDFYEETRLSIDQLKTIVMESQVRYRGWYYPHYNSPDGISITSQNSIGSSVDWNGHIEYWEFFRSGQFAHIFSMREDYLLISEEEKTKVRNRVWRGSDIESVDKFFEIVSAVYQLTEIYAFAKNLCQRTEFSSISRFEIVIELHDVENRMLFIWDWGRDLWAPYISHLAKPIVFKNEYRKENLIANFDTIALENAKELFILFNWSQPNMQAMTEDQRKLLERRF